MGIREYLGKGFERHLYEASVKNLFDIDNPISLNSFSYSLRELISNYLHRVAPDANVQQCDWFSPTPNANGGVTRADRIKYSIQGGLSDDFVRDVLGIDISQTVSNMVKKINILSKYTHIRPETFNLEREFVKTESKAILRAFRDALVLSNDQKSSLIEVLWNNIDESVIYTAITETVDGIDELASHHYIESVETHELEIVAINDQSVYFSAEGYVQCELQWGSDGDQRRGDGAILSTSFPFTCLLQSSVFDPYDVETDGSRFKVDNSSWHE